MDEKSMHSDEYLWQSLREKCPYSELFWSVFSRIETEYGEIPDTFYGHFLNTYQLWNK